MIQQNLKAFVCWSGGKESAFSLYIAMKQGIEVSYLLNMISEDGKHCRSHGVNTSLLRKQAECIGIPLIQAKSSWQEYEKVFKKAVSGLDSVEAGVFGDIDLQEHRDWVERICKDLGIMPILPLWKERRENLFRQFIKIGFEAIVVATKADCMSKEWLGRIVDEEFIKDLKTKDNIDLCGEAGEYHTFVFNGPIFKRPVEITPGEKIIRENHWFLEIK